MMIERRVCLKSSGEQKGGKATKPVYPLGELGSMAGPSQQKTRSNISPAAGILVLTPRGALH